MISAHIFSRRLRNRNRTRSRSPVTIDLELQTTSQILVRRTTSDSSCIDLTCDDDDVVTVDLTSVNDSSVVYIDSQPTRPRRPRRCNYRARTNIFYPPINIVESENEDELQELPLPSFVNPNAQRSEASSNSATSIACPICLDEDKRLQETHRHLMSTTCGHVFCNNCLTTALQAQRKCPTCRRRLTIRQIHPLFI